ncbi:50S ribosomal protein L21 [bacterium]|nr:50S ribosomal protein L21 [bacterium]|tara:strand:+ start:10766 stop:11077 length:312 start_codon:yes stop_codon:yes gene_type:complete
MKNFAIIKTGGKQYKVAQGDVIKIEKLEGKAGDKIEFNKILLLKKNKITKIGQPFIKNTKVSAEIIEQARDKKVIVFKYKAKKRYKKKKGHRQPFTKIKILKI